MAEQDWKAFDLEAMIEKQIASGQPYHEFLRVPALSCGIYSLPAGAKDLQGPHDEDEVYFVLSGRGRVRVEGEDRAVESGTVLYVAATSEHSFFEIDEGIRSSIFSSISRHSVISRRSASSDHGDQQAAAMRLPSRVVAASRRERPSRSSAITEPSESRHRVRGRHDRGERADEDEHRGECVAVPAGGPGLPSSIGITSSRPPAPPRLEARDRGQPDQGHDQRGRQRHEGHQREGAPQVSPARGRVDALDRLRVDDARQAQQHQIVLNQLAVSRASGRGPPRDARATSLGWSCAPIPPASPRIQPAAAKPRARSSIRMPWAASVQATARIPPSVS